MCPWLTDLQRLMIEMLSHLLKYGYIPAQHGPKMALFLVLVFFSSIISYCPSMPCTACVPYRCSVLQAWSASYDGSSCTCLPLYGRAFLPAVVQLKLALKSLLQAEHVNFIGQSISLPSCRQMPPLSLPCAVCSEPPLTQSLQFFKYSENFSVDQLVESAWRGWHLRLCRMVKVWGCIERWSSSPFPFSDGPMLSGSG